MFDHFCTSGNKNNVSLTSMERNTSVSSLVMSITEDNTEVSQSHPNTHPITCSCPFPGIATLVFDMTLLMSHKIESFKSQNGSDQMSNFSKERVIEGPESGPLSTYGLQETTSDATEYTDWAHSLEGSLFRFSLSVLHLWNVDYELDKLLTSEMKLKKPKNLFLASGLLGDRGSLTLTFPGQSSTLELWRSSSEFCAIRSLTMVSLAQHMLLISFWQDQNEQVRMAARSLFHCAASRAIPRPLRADSNSNTLLNSETENVLKDVKHEKEDSEMVAWLESFERQDWISCVWGTSRDAMTSHIVVAAALVVWYPSLVKSTLATLCVHPLLKLVMAMNERYSSTAAEILAEGMENTWSAIISSEIPHLISDIFHQIEHNSVTSVEIRESLVGILLPSLAMANVPSFLQVIERQIWSTASDSPVHIVSLMTLIRVTRGSPRNLAPYLDKTMDPGNSAMRRNCLQSSMATLKEVVRVFPMVALNDSSTRLAVGDAIGHINKAIIRVYEMQSMTKIKILDASAPPGLPTLLGGVSETTVNTAISVLSFSPDGEMVVNRIHVVGKA
ncbi:uncharacterized protein LOC143627254 [Bidens hawaiensis]|uniref:uncharacterized protein LOC143627254 n=1 Tax=Bidens hawaiensis TaxID=980011 RepID=UPI0040494BE2